MSSVFPQPAAPVTGTSGRPELVVTSGGLTKRELFAAMAMQGLITGTDSRKSLFGLVEKNGSPTAFVAGMALEYADALLASLAKEPP